MNTLRARQNKTLLVFGAGSTAFLGMPVSGKQAEILKKVKNDGSRLARLKAIILDLFGNDFGIGDVYNIVDSCIALGKSLTSKNKELVLACDELRFARKELIGAIFDEFREKIEGRGKGDYETLVDFYYRLAKDELTHKLSTCCDLQKRENFLASYVVASFNWDLYSILPLVEAHDRLNHDNPCRLSKKGIPEFRVYTDFNCECASSLGEGENPWYPFTESVANVVNNDRYEASRRAMLVKAYFPHGLMNMYKCPGCGRHSLYMGEAGEKRLQLDAVNKGTGKEDVYVCPYCGSKIGRLDFEALAQSNFKVRSPYLEELRLAFYDELAQADRIVFIGYSLPDDDIELRTIMKAYCQDAEIYVVALGKTPQQSKFVEASSTNVPYDDGPDADNACYFTVKRFKDAFKTNRLFFNLAGFPSSVNEILDLVRHKNA